MPRGALRGRARKQVHAERTTRSSKAKNLQYGLEDPEQAEKQLTAQLKAMGLYAANTLGDGNCLFRALSDQLYGYPNQHLQIRHAICDYLQAHPEKYAGFVDDAKPFDAYVKNMRQQGTYGGHLELSAFAHLKRKQIKIVQPNLVYVVAASDEGDDASSVGQDARHDYGDDHGYAASSEQQLPPTTRQLRRLKREGRGSGASAVPASEPSAGPSSSTPPSASTAQATTSSSSSSSQPPQLPSASASASSIVSPVKSSSATSASHASSATSASSSSSIHQSASTSSPASKSHAQTVPHASASAPVEATGPLYIAYHNWEHYSSIRNLDGPHSGLPRIREKPINQADLAKEFSTIAAKAAKRGGLPLGKGKAKANTQPGTSSLDSDRPTEEEKLVMDSAPGHSLFEVRQLLKLLGSWEDVVEKLVAEDQADSESGGGPESSVRPAPPSASAVIKPHEPPRPGLPVHVLPETTVDDDVPVPTPSLPSVIQTGIAPPPPHLPSSISAQPPQAGPGLGQKQQQIANDIAWRAGSPSSVGTAASARSSASMLTAATSSSTSTVPTSDDWNATETMSSSGTRTPAAGQTPGAETIKEEETGIDGEPYLALSPDSTITAREMSVLEDGAGHSQAMSVGEDASLPAHMRTGAGGNVGSGRVSPSAFKRKANHGHEVGADADDDSELSFKRFSPARGQCGEGCQFAPSSSAATTAAVSMAHGLPAAAGRKVVPSSVSPSPGSVTSESADARRPGDPSLRSLGPVPSSVTRVGAVRSGLTRMDAISIGSGSSSSSESDVPVGILKAVPLSGGGGGGPPRDGLLPPHDATIVDPPLQQRGAAVAMANHRRQLSARAGSANGSGSTGSTDEDSIASSRPRRATSLAVDYRASALGRTGEAGPGQLPVSVTVSVTGAQAKRAKRDQKRAEKAERERAKARARRLGRGLGVREDEDEEDGEGEAAAVPAQFAFRELRI